MTVYTGSPENADELIRFVRREIDNLRSLRKLVISRQETVLYDINKDGITFPGLTYGSAALEPLLHELGVVFAAQTLHNPDATPSGVKEFDLSARAPWGEERVM